LYFASIPIIISKILPSKVIYTSVSRVEKEKQVKVGGKGENCTRKAIGEKEKIIHMETGICLCLFLFPRAKAFPFSRFQGGIPFFYAYHPITGKVESSFQC
jgi:hypothetical protein